MKALLITMRYALQEAASNRLALWIQMTVMVINDLVWVLFWVIFFDRVGALRGWDVDQVLLLLAVLTTSAGLVLGLFHNVRNIGPLASSGGLDAALALPVHPLTHLLVRAVAPVNLGDVVFGIALFLYVARFDPRQAAVFVFAVVCSATLTLSFLLLMGSLAFFVGRNEGGELGFHAILLFSSYPVDIFTGVFKVLLYTVVPAGFVTSVPVRLLDDFDLTLGLGLAAVSAAFAVAAVATFSYGLRRYTSGATWVRA
ncbi:MAG: ABC-2 family transporter protein [Acidimicrobiales bacterium]